MQDSFTSIPINGSDLGHLLMIILNIFYMRLIIQQMPQA